MNKIKVKLAALFTAVCCCLGCLGIGVALSQPKDENVVAKAATVEELTAEFTNNGQFVLEQDTITNHTPTILEGTAVTEATLPDGYKGAVLQAHRSSSTDGWDAVRFNFTAAQIKAADVSSIVVRAWVENFNSETDEIRVIGANGTTRQYGVGKFDLSTWCDVPLKVNSIADMTDENGYLSVTEFRLRDKPEASHLYIDSVTVNLTTEFTDNSQFTVSPYSENMELSYQFDESLPSGWSDTVMRIKTYSGQAYVNVDFSNAQLKATDVESISVRAYSPDYTSADEFRFNNVNVSGNVGKYDMSTWCDIPVDISKIKTDENGYLTTIYFGLRDKGTSSTYFYIDSITVKEVEYTTYNLDGLTFRKWDASKNHIYLTPNGDWERPDDGNGGWTANFASKNGVGIMFGETQIATARFPGDMFIELGAAPAEGDVLTIGGTFYNAGCAVEYVIPECQFVWNGTTWEVYEGTVTPDPEPEYTTYNLEGLTFRKWDASKNHIYLPLVGDWEKPDDGNGGWTADFLSKNGVGVTFGEKTIETVRFPSEMFIELGSAPVEGDVLTVGGTFYNEGCAVEYVIPESKFVWNGTTWEVYVEYSVTELGALTVHPHSAGTTANPPKATQLYMSSAVELPFTAWSDKFTLESGDGWKLNGNAITPAEFISAEGNMYANLTNANVQAGDVLSVSGTFVHQTEPAKYVIEESKFVWNGTTWENYIEYQTNELGALKIHDWNSTDNSIIFLPADDRAIPVPEGADLWNTAFLCKDGVGVTLNGETAVAEIKFPNNIFIVLSSAPKKGDALVVAGTFSNETYAWEYVVEESKFVYNGTAWEAYEEKTVELGKVVLTGQSISSPATNRLYLKSADGIALEVYDFAYVSGTGVVIDDVSYNEDSNVSTLRVSDSTIFRFYLSSISTIGEGAVITVGGTFRNAAKGTTYVIEDSSFIWNGTTWLNYVTNDKLEAYDIITIQDIGLGAEVTWEGTVNEVQRQFAPSDGNTTNSLAFRFGYNCEDTALDGATLYFRFRGSNWQGILIELKKGEIYLRDAGKSYALTSNTDYVIEISAISMKDGKVWTYVKLDEVMVLSEVITTDQFVEFEEFTETGFTNHVSIYASGIAKTTITDPDGIAVKYVSSAGTYVEKVRKDQLYTLATGKSEKVFIAWEYDGELYAAGQEFGVIETAITFTAVELDFTMEAGASIRLSPTADYSGIRFTSRINEAEWQVLLEKYAPTSFSYGTLIMPYDYLEYGQKPNLNDFVVGEELLKIECENGQSANGYFVMRGAMQKIYEGNYGRLFAGRAYIEITLANGMVLTAYTAFDNEDNVRSIRQVARAFKADTSEPQSANELRYHTITEEQRGIVNAYIGEEEIRLMNYDVYAANATSIIAWNFPALDPTNNYINDANIAVANTMKEAGIQMIGLTGANIVKMDTPAKIEQTRQIINFFWLQGIYTFAFQSNGGNKLGINFAQAYPDFSDCEGFIGFLAWDEPSVDAMDTIATQVEAFEAAYAGTDVTFMGNLLPSYASIFNTNGALDKAAFKAYLQKYCEVVLSQVSGEKWLSIDTYPIYADKTLLKNFLFDIGTLKTVALKNDAHAHVILQSYGYVIDGNDDRERMPSEAELRMQAYTAMAFGVDSMSWFVYSPNGSGENDTAVDVNGAITNQDNYNAFKNVNAELTAIGKVYNAFAWKGIILGAGNDNGTNIGSWEITKDNDYKAFEMVMGQLGDYELSANDTKHLSSVQTNKTDWNYLMGVMEDAHGNEGYVLCNYNSHEADRAQTITLTFDSNVTEAVIYRGGVAQTVSVTDKTLTVDLATGEGVIILPSKLN